VPSWEEADSPVEAEASDEADTSAEAEVSEEADTSDDASVAASELEASALEAASALCIDAVSALEDKSAL